MLSKKTLPDFPTTRVNSPPRKIPKNDTTPKATRLIGRDRVVQVPVRLVGGPEDDLFFLQIPEKTLNNSKLSSVIRIELLNSSYYDPKDLEFVNTTEGENYPTNFPNFSVSETVEKNSPSNKNKKFVPFVINRETLPRKPAPSLTRKIDIGLTESAIYHVQNSPNANKNTRLGANRGSARHDRRWPVNNKVRQPPNVLTTATDDDFNEVSLKRE